MNSELRKNCPMRHENGNCTPCGGFCTAVNDPICKGLHNAYDTGVYVGALRAQEERERNDPLTLEELREMDGEPVWVERPDGYKSYNGWALVDVSWKAQSVIYLACTHGSTTLCVSLLHSGGKVYRHKPELPKEGETNGTTDLHRQ